MRTKDLSGNMWHYGSYHVHVLLKFRVLVSHTSNRPTTLVLLMLSLTWFVDLGIYEGIYFGITFGPKKVFGEGFNYKTYFFLSANNERAKRWCAKYMDRRIFLSRRQYFYEAIYTKDYEQRKSKTIVGRIYVTKVVF